MRIPPRNRRGPVPIQVRTARGNARWRLRKVPAPRTSARKAVARRLEEGLKGSQRQGAEKGGQVRADCPLPAQSAQAAAMTDDLRACLESS